MDSQDICGGVGTDGPGKRGTTTEELERLRDQPLVAAAVLNWNDWRRTVRAVRSVGRSEHARLRIVIVDNGSIDESVTRLSTTFPRATILEASSNSGFAAGCNFAILHARTIGASYVWLLNNDVAVHPSTLPSMVEIAESHPDVGAVGSLLVEMTDPTKIQAYGGGTINFWTGLARHCLSVPPSGQPDYIVGASILLRIAAVNEVGLLDEGFFLYWEDADLSFRLRDAGWRLAIADRAVVRHEGNASLALKSPGWDFEYTASSMRFFRRHARMPWIPIAVSGIGRLLCRVLGGRWRNMRAVAAALSGIGTASHAVGSRDR